MGKSRKKMVIFPVHINLVKLVHFIRTKKVLHQFRHFIRTRSFCISLDSGKNCEHCTAISSRNVYSRAFVLFLLFERLFSFCSFSIFWRASSSIFLSDQIEIDRKYRLLTTWTGWIQKRPSLQHQSGLGTPKWTSYSACGICRVNLFLKFWHVWNTCIGTDFRRYYNSIPDCLFRGCWLCCHTKFAKTFYDDNKHNEKLPFLYFFSAPECHNSDGLGLCRKNMSFRAHFEWAGFA